jgi:alpha-mannosidase
VFGLAVLNDAKYGFDVLGGELGVTAVRSPIFAHHEPTIPKPAIRYQYQDQGLQRFRLALVPHRGGATEAGLTRLAVEHNEPSTVLIESFHDGDLPLAASHGSVSPDNVIVGALKVAEDGDGLIVRLAETAGRSADARVELPGWDRTIEAAMGPWEVRTFLVRADGGEPVETDLLERPVDDVASAPAGDGEAGAAD